MRTKLVVAITGASGVIYGVRMLELLKQSDIEVHLVVSEAGEKVLGIECPRLFDDMTERKSLFDSVHAFYDYKDICAPIASGSFLTDGMVVIPCTMKTLSGIAHSYADNLIVRAADVALKERRKLVLVVRETPFHSGHLELMLRASEMGAVIFPPVPSFHHISTRGTTSKEFAFKLIDHTVGRVLDQLGIAHELLSRWEGVKEGRMKE